MTTFVSFNINGLRARPHQLTAIDQLFHPTIIGLQETKVHDDAFPLDIIHHLGYHVEFFGQKSHYGVALLSKTPPIFVQKGFLSDDETAQKRFIHARYDINGQHIEVLNGYFPQGENRSHDIKFPMKQAFYANLINYIAELKRHNDKIILMGDMNVAPTDSDVGIGDGNAKRWLKTGVCSFLPEERQWYQELLAQGLHDSYRQFHPDTDDKFSWFDYRSKGFDDNPKRGLRIDHILCSDSLIQLCTDADINYQIRSMEKPSDHTAIWAKFEL